MLPVSRSARCSGGLPDTAPPGWLDWQERNAPILGPRKLPAELVQVIEGMALRKPRPSIAAMHQLEDYALATQHQWMPPSYGSVYGIVRQVESGHGHACAGRSCGFS